MSVGYLRCITRGGDISTRRQRWLREAESTTRARPKDDTKPSEPMLLDCLKRDSKSLNHTVFVRDACLALDSRPRKTVLRT